MGLLLYLTSGSETNEGVAKDWGSNLGPVDCDRCFSL